MAADSGAGVGGGGFDWVTVGVAVIGVVGALLQRRRQADPRGDLRRDLELWEKMPESDARSELLAYVERRVQGLVADERRRRSPFGITLGAVLLASGVWLTVAAAQAGGAWRLAWVLTLPLAITGLAGAMTDLRKVERDDRGREVREVDVRQDREPAPRPRD